MKTKSMTPFFFLLAALFLIIGIFSYSRNSIAEIKPGLLFSNSGWDDKGPWLDFVELKAKLSDGKWRAEVTRYRRNGTCSQWTYDAYYSSISSNNQLLEAPEPKPAVVEVAP